MKLISHRGNIDWVHPQSENKEWYIQQAIDLGYDVEIDVRLIKDKLYLGHDKPEDVVELSWLLDRKQYLWVHTKNYEALCHLIDTPLRIFYHQQENHTIINNCNLIWSHNINVAKEKSIIPLLSKDDIEEADCAIDANVYGICSDFVVLIRKQFKV